MSKTSTDEIVSTLTRSIACRRLMPGTKLAEQQLANHFSVSRTIIRQALHKLSQKHLVRIEHSRGTFVATPSVEESKQIFELRRMLEMGIVQELAQRIDSKDIEILKSYLEREHEAMPTYIDGFDGTEFLDNFQIFLTKILNNDVLTNLLHELTLRCSLVTLIYQSDRATLNTENYHDAIIKALIDKDGVTASNLTLRYLQDVEATLVYY